MEVQALQAQVDAHTLMAVAGASSFALGFPLEGALLFSLFHVAHVLEGVFVNRAQSNLSGLIDSLPKTIRIVSPAQDGTIDWISQEQVPVDDVAIGSLIAVKPGELVPLDGTVHSGTALLGTLPRPPAIPILKRLQARPSPQVSAYAELNASLAYLPRSSLRHVLTSTCQLVLADAGQESITGESLPVLKRPGSNVYSGGQVHDGTLIIRTTTRATDTTTARIVRITSTAMRNKAAVQTFLSRVTSRWSQALISLTMLALVTLIATGVPLLGKHGALYRALALLTAGAPCALALAPLTFVCAMATLSRNGIIVKGSNVLDRLAGISFVALDKTGTLSEGQLRFVSTTPLQPGSSAAKADALVKAAALSLQGTHPVCDAVLDAYGDMGGARAASLLPTVTSFQLVPGAGMSGEVDGKKCLFGSVEHVRDCLNPTQVDMLRQAVEQHGAGQVVSVLLVYGLPGRGSTHGASDVESMHVLAFSDMPKKDSGQGMQLIRKLCRGVGMYTGDNAASAAILGKLVGLRHGEVHAGLAPEGKSDCIKALQQQGEYVFMVGDGLNDAPALATADVSAVFTESVDTSVAGVADVAVLREGTAGAHGGDVGRVAFLLQMAQSARVNVMQNLGLAVVSMVVAVVPSLMGVLPLWIAVLVHEGSTVLVALNSCRLLFMRPRMV